MARTFDEVELIDRVGGDVEFLGEMVGMLSIDGPGLLEDVRAAIADGDAPAVGRHAHSLKGMVSNFCASETYGCALELEGIGRSGDLARAGEVFVRLERHVDDLASELSDFVRARA